MTFDDFKFDDRISAGIKAAGFVTPTPVQAGTIEPAMTGRDVMGLAQTGTGKTAAFVLPMLSKLMKGPRRKLRALVVTPTRELAEQIHGDIRTLGRKTGLKSATVYGGVSMNNQIKNIRGGAEIVVACPGRLLDHLRQKTMDLRNIELLVLDEADHMLDMGFLPDVRRILDHLPKNRQTLFFSATMPPVIRRLADDILSDPAVVQLEHSRPAKTLSHAIYPVEPHLKSQLLINLLRETEIERVLIFSRTKIRTMRLANQLQKAGFKAASLQGDMPQNKRQATLNAFKSNDCPILVATDIAARGVDVTGISHVINFDPPDTVENYTHRVGRTGRAERQGSAFTFVTYEDRTKVREIEKIIDGDLLCCEAQGFTYNFPAENGEATEKEGKVTGKSNRLVIRTSKYSSNQPAARGVRSGNRRPPANMRRRPSALA